MCEFNYLLCELVGSVLLGMCVCVCVRGIFTGADRYILKDKRLLRVDWYN